MANVIQIKRRTSGATGSPATLAVAELAYNEVDNVLYIGRSNSTIDTVGGTGAFIAKTGSHTAAGSYTFNTGTVTLDGTVTGTGINTYVLGKRLNEFTVPNANVAFNNQRITGLADPVNDQDAATKAYVDAARSGLDVKASVRAATTAEITLSGTQTVDGVTLVAGDRVLVKNQSTASANGIYVVAAGVWSRATDADSSAEVTAGIFTFVEEGTTNADSGWVLTTDAPVTLGTTALTFTQFSGAGQITAGAGMTKSGNTLDVVTASASRIVVNADSIDLATTGVSSGTYTSVTVDTYGRVTAGANPVVVASGKTLTANNTVTFTGTDGASLAVGAGGTVAYTGNKLSAFAATTSAELAGVISDETGSGGLVFANSPSFTTPVLGAATATTINKVTITAPAAGSTITVADGKTLTVSNTVTFTGTDGSSVAFGAGGTIAYLANKLSGFASTTSSELAGVISDETGTGSLVFANTPTLVTPVLGVASATTINKVTITTPATGSTLTVADGKTLTCSNTLTFTGTDSSSVAFGTGGTVAYIGAANAFTGANTFVNATGQTFRVAAGNDGIVIKGRAGGSSTFNATLDTATLTVSRAYSLPDHGASITACTILSNESTVDGGTF